MLNYNDAERQTGDVIPNNTLAKVVMKIRPGGFSDPQNGLPDGLGRMSESGAIFLDCEYTVLEGPYAKRKVFSNLGLYSPKGPKWGDMGRSLIRGILESARNVHPTDTSDKAFQARQIHSLADLQGIEFIAKIEVEEDDRGEKNRIQTAITPDHKRYQDLMFGGGQGPAQGSAPAPAAPSWAQDGQQPQAPQQQPQQPQQGQQPQWGGGEQQAPQQPAQQPQQQPQWGGNQQPQQPPQQGGGLPQWAQ